MRSDIETRDRVVRRLEHMTLETASHQTEVVMLVRQVQGVTFRVCDQAIHTGSEITYLRVYLATNLKNDLKIT